MHAQLTRFLIVTACVLCSVSNAAVYGELLVTKIEKGVPVVQVGTNDFYTAHRIIRYLEENTPEVKPEKPKDWRKLYDVVSKALVRSAEEARLDSRSLEKLLKTLPGAKENRGVALIPVAAHQTEENNEPVWVITLRWEIESAVVKGIRMAHLRHFSFFRKSLKQSGFITCG